MRLKAVVFLLTLVFTMDQPFVYSQSTEIIPYPIETIRGQGFFTFNSKTTFYYTKKDSIVQGSIQPLLQKLSDAAGFKLTYSANKAQRNVVSVSLTADVAEAGGYVIKVTPESVDIKAKDPVGVFYAIQSLLQLLPPEIEGRSISSTIAWKLPSVIIRDAPAFRYRGLMLDVSRHFLPLPFLKRLIDLMAMQKMNNLHLHLTDDQGWRIEIKKYPRLTSIGGVRSGTLQDKYPGKGNDNNEYKGYYTQEEIKELVAYAAKKFINIVPEIELPGHSSAAIAAYPALSCFPEESSYTAEAMHSKAALEKAKVAGTKIVQESWGVFNDVLCPSDFTFQFMQDVLDEVIDLFPSKYIHIGGDECPKDFWKRSSLCQDLIKKYDLKDEHVLQSYFIQRIEQHINKRGRNIIGWDEILEGGLAPNAAVMSWRGTSGGIESAKQSHDVIMSPDGYCYLNFYQSEDPGDSIAWGGFLPLKRVYSYDPIPTELDSAQRKFIMGVQGNLWTEYVKSTALAEYMLFPRAIALAEVGWSRNKPGFENFAERLMPYLKRLDQLKVNYSRHLFDIALQSKYVPDQNAVQVGITGVPGKTNIYYSITDQQGRVEKHKYNHPFVVRSSAKLEAIVEAEGQVVGRSSAMFNINKATGKKIILAEQPAKAYSKGGAVCLVNGIIGSSNRYSDTEWLGWDGKDFNATIQFNEPTEIGKVSLRFFNNTSSWVYPPSSITLLGSTDGVNFTEINNLDIRNRGEGAVQVTQLQFNKIKLSHLKVVAKNHGIISKSNPGEGYPAWLFVDELMVE
ncbi:MAG: beta-N-acetylhexosaminidase [bacterium]